MSDFDLQSAIALETLQRQQDAEWCYQRILKLENALRRLVLCADQPGDERDAAISEGWKLIYGPR